MTVKYPHVTEKGVDKMDFQNKMQFIVELDASKEEVAAAVEERFDVTVEGVTTQVTPDAEKKAEVQLSDDDDAQEIASRIGVF
jgi:large subunit ribosomal protein L23